MEERVKQSDFYRSSLERLVDDLVYLKDKYNSKSCSEELKKIISKEIEVAEKLIKLDRARWSTTPRTDLDFYPCFEVPIVDHCNYNCAYCNHWSNIAPKHFYDYDQLMKDLKRLSYLYDGNCTIKLMGGEPMIHPRIKDIFINARPLFNSVQILTNGLTLIRDVKKKDFSMFDIFEEYDIKLEITRYPYLDYSGLFKTLERYHFVTDYEAELGNPNSMRSTMQIHGVNINGNPDWKNRHLSCGNSNRTSNMKDGKVYACPFKACLDIFIKHFGLEDKMKVTEKDYIDIYKAQSKEEIALFLTKGTQACQYCTGDTLNFSPESHPWRRTTKSITEWIDSRGIEMSLHTEDFDILNK